MVLELLLCTSVMFVFCSATFGIHVVRLCVFDARILDTVLNINLLFHFFRLFYS